MASDLLELSSTLLELCNLTASIYLWDVSEFTVLHHVSIRAYFPPLSFLFGTRLCLCKLLLTLASTRKPVTVQLLH